MNKREIVNKIVETLIPSFEAIGFRLKSSNRFEKKNNKSLYIYEIDVAKLKGRYSLHLKLYLQNKEITDGVNLILKKVLTDPSIEYPNNFTQKIIDDIIKGRTSNKNVYGLTDWRYFKKEEQTLENFNNFFSIWFTTFEKLEDKENWKAELIRSVNYTDIWFDFVDNDTYLIEHTEYVSMYLLKVQNNLPGLEVKYKEIYNRKKTQNQDTIELELFNKYLLLGS